MKICNQCKIEFPLNNFYKNKNCKNGILNICKKCKLENDKKYIENNREKTSNYQKQYRESNKEEIKNKKDTWWKNNKNNEDMILKRQNYRMGHKKDKQEYDRKYKLNNKNRINKRHKDRVNADIKYKLSVNLRKRLNKALKNNYKSGSAVKDLGCSIEFLKQYLENKFNSHPITGEMMTWDNHSLYGWHIDHIKPLASFDLTNREQFLKACHFSNLQPLWAEFNLSKGAK